MSITRTGPETLIAAIGPDTSLRAEGSMGRGNQTLAPWIRVFDPIAAEGDPLQQIAEQMALHGMDRPAPEPRKRDATV